MPPHLLLLVATILLATGPLNALHSPVQLHGTDLFDPWLGEFLESQNLPFKVDTRMKGSFSGVKAFEKIRFLK